MTARYPAMFAIADSVSIFCARVIRGTLSIAKTVAFFLARRSTTSRFCPGQINPTSQPPSRSRSASLSSGGRTFITTSDDSPEVGGIRDDRRTGFLIFGVARVDLVSGTGFDGDVETELS